MDSEFPSVILFGIAIITPYLLTSIMGFYGRGSLSLELLRVNSVEQSRKVNGKAKTVTAFEKI